MAIDNLIIRKAKLEDKESVNLAHVRSIREICSKDYSPDQIEKWSSIKYSDDIWNNTVNNDCCYLVEWNSEIHGFCHAKIHTDKRGEIAGLYLTPEIIGKGIGRQVFTKCLTYLKQCKPDQIFITGTKTAQGFYRSMGFKTIEEKELQIRGIAIECYYMELDLQRII